MRNLYRHGSRGAVPIVLFIMLIWLPLADLALGLDPTPDLIENRTMTLPPSLRSPILAVLDQPTDVETWSGLLRAAASYPRNFTLYFNDHFGFRRFLVRLHGRLVLLGWPTKGNVILGQQGWLFFGEAKTRESYQASSLFNQVELDNWLSELERRRRWLAERGCDYLLVVAPEKSTIYQDLMPSNVPRIGRQTRLDQLIRHLEDNSDVQIVDLREALVQARTEHETYYRTDTHWNDWGAFVASQRILQDVAESCPVVQVPISNDYIFTEQEGPGGDLAGMMALKDVLTDLEIVAEPVAPTRAQPASAGTDPVPNLAPWGQPQAWEIPGKGLPTAVVFRDSFGNALIPFLSEHFSRILYLHQYSLDEATILRERPSIVIQELAERELQGSTPPEQSGQ